MKNINLGNAEIFQPREPYIFCNMYGCNVALSGMSRKCACAHCTKDDTQCINQCQIYANNHSENPITELKRLQEQCCLACMNENLR